RRWRTIVPRSTWRRTTPTSKRSSPISSGASRPRSRRHRRRRSNRSRRLAYHSSPSRWIRRATGRSGGSQRSSSGSPRSMSHAPTAALSARHQSVRQSAASLALDALVVTSLPNILYLTNFTGSSAIVVVQQDHLYFVTDFRYLTAVQDA